MITLIRTKARCLSGFILNHLGTFAMTYIETQICGRCQLKRTAAFWEH